MSGILIHALLRGIWKYTPVGDITEEAIGRTVETVIGAETLERWAERSDAKAAQKELREKEEYCEREGISLDEYEDYWLSENHYWKEYIRLEQIAEEQLSRPVRLLQGVVGSMLGLSMFTPFVILVAMAISDKALPWHIIILASIISIIGFSIGCYKTNCLTKRKNRERLKELMAEHGVPESFQPGWDTN